MIFAIKENKRKVLVEWYFYHVYHAFCQEHYAFLPWVLLTLTRGSFTMYFYHVEWYFYHVFLSCRGIFTMYFYHVEWYFYHVEVFLPLHGKKNGKKKHGKKMVKKKW